MHGVQEDVKMLETHSISNHQIGLGKTGSMGLNRTMHYISPGQDYLWETPLSSQSFESCSLLIENMATFGTDAD